MPLKRKIGLAALLAVGNFLLLNSPLLTFICSRGPLSSPASSESYVYIHRFKLQLANLHLRGSYLCLP